MLTFVSSITRQSQTHPAEKRESMARITNLSKGFGLESKEHWRLVKCAHMLIFRWPRAEHGFQMVLVFLQSSFGVLDADVWNQG